MIEAIKGHVLEIVGLLTVLGLLLKHFMTLFRQSTKALRDIKTEIKEFLPKKDETTAKRKKEEGNELSSTVRATLGEKIEFLIVGSVIWLDVLWKVTKPSPLPNSEILVIIIEVSLFVAGVSLLIVASFLRALASNVTMLASLSLHSVRSQSRIIDTIILTLPEEKRPPGWEKILERREKDE